MIDPIDIDTGDGHLNKSAFPNLNCWWCSIIVHAWFQAGIREVVTCPGNRNVPLLWALQRHRGLRLTPHVDERSAAFIALGLARATQAPVAVCTTSGTAVANLLPASCEAYQAQVPLVLVSADRPARLHGCGAPQTMQQRGLFSTACIDELHLPEPSADGSAAAHMRDSVLKLLNRGAGPSPGPVHLNVPLDDPLPPIPDPQFKTPTVAVRPRPRNPGQVTAVLNVVDTPLRNPIYQPHLRGVIVAGPDLPIRVEDAQILARQTGFPVIADAPSNLRHPDTPQLMTTADALLGGGALADTQADLIIRLGPAPIARSTYEWLQRQQCPVLRIDRHPIEQDFCHEQFDTFVRPSPSELLRLGERLKGGNQAWSTAWQQAEQQALIQRQRWLQTAGWNEVSAAALACESAQIETIALANSLAVRHGNLHLGAHSSRHAFANRGVNGIDGTIGMFVGLLLARPRQPGLLLTGDLALLHDLPALAACAGRTDINGTILVLDNGGGGIFDLLPRSDNKPLQQLIQTPTNWSPIHQAQSFGLGHRCCRSLIELRTALDWSSNEPGVQLLIAQEFAQANAAEPMRGLLNSMRR